MIDSNQKELIARMMDFCEENWSAFVNRCEDCGHTEEWIDETIDKLKKENNS